MNAKKSAKAEAKDAKTAGAPQGTPRMLEKYNTVVLPRLAEELGRTNKLSLPRLLKITINQGVGIAMQDKKHIEVASEALSLIFLQDLDPNSPDPSTVFSKYNYGGALTNGYIHGISAVLRPADL